jgi:hypothetical protein
LELLVVLDYKLLTILQLKPASKMVQQLLVHLILSVIKLPPLVLDLVGQLYHGHKAFKQLK